MRIGMLVAAAASCLPALMVSAADQMPERVAEEVKFAVKYCSDRGGAPNTDKLFTQKDINGDGQTDWIADYARFACAGIENPFCSASGCILKLFMWMPEGHWASLAESARRYTFSSDGVNTRLEIVMGGVRCDRPNEEDCTLKYFAHGPEWAPAE